MWIAWISLCLVLVVGAARAATPVKSLPPPPTLSDALKTARSPQEGVVLTVGAEKIILPTTAVLPVAGATLEDVADTFGRMVLTSGSVTVLAPPTMAVLNPNPPPADPYAHLNAFGAFPMLIASLNDAQWGLLTSEKGLGLPDLDTDTERSLFRVLFARGLFVASRDPELVQMDDDKRPDVQDLSRQSDDARIRLGQTARIRVHDTKGDTLFYTVPPPDRQSHLTLFRPKQPPAQKAYGIPVRVLVPNASKGSDLAFSLAALRASVPLNKLTTLGELIDRVRTSTGVEIYADPHYAGKTVTVLGASPSASAKDILQALALCVCGTYRKVGPAFVLTDDLEGVGRRRLRLSQWDDAARSNSIRVKEQAGAALLAHRAAEARTLSGFDDPLALTSAQMKALPPNDFTPEIPGNFDDSVPLKDLTPAQQAQARHTADMFNAARADGTLPGYLEEKKNRVPDLSGSVNLRAATVVQILLPSLPVPIDTEWSYGDISLLYFPGEDAISAGVIAQTAAYKKKHPKGYPPLASLLKQGKRRALIGHPRTAAEVDALLVALHKLGLNELYLDVFSEGQAHVPGSTLSLSAPLVGNDILTEALLRGPKLGIAVFADLNLLAWGDAPPLETDDLTLLGETSAEAAAHAHERDPEPTFDDATGKLVPFALPPVAVSPRSSLVRTALSALVRSLAARPGLAGFVWEDAEEDDALGYTDAERLKFLRTAHADPIDLTPENYVPFDLSLPEWDNAGVEGTLSEQWSDGRQQDCDRLLLSLRRIVGPSLPILRPDEDDGTDFLAEWRDDTKKPPKLLRVPSDDPDMLSNRMQSGWKNRAWSGYVLDWEDKNATRGSSPLAGLLTAVNDIPSR